MKSSRAAHTHFIAWKPYGVLTKFTDAEGRPTLASLGFDFPRDVYAVGRLDMDSEGLLFLTSDGSLNERLLDPRAGHEREYLAQVERVPDAGALARLEAGVLLDAKKTLPARARA